MLKPFPDARRVALVTAAALLAACSGGGEPTDDSNVEAMLTLSGTHALATALGPGVTTRVNGAGFLGTARTQQRFVGLVPLVASDAPVLIEIIGPRDKNVLRQVSLLGSMNELIAEAGANRVLDSGTNDWLRITPASASASEIIRRQPGAQNGADAATRDRLATGIAPDHLMQSAGLLAALLAETYPLPASHANTSLLMGDDAGRLAAMLDAADTIDFGAAMAVAVVQSGEAPLAETPPLTLTLVDGRRDGYSVLRVELDAVGGRASDNEGLSIAIDNWQRDGSGYAIDFDGSHAVEGSLAQAPCNPGIGPVRVIRRFSGLRLVPMLSLGDRQLHAEQRDFTLEFPDGECPDQAGQRTVPRAMFRALDDALPDFPFAPADGDVLALAVPTNDTASFEGRSELFRFNGNGTAQALGVSGPAGTLSWQLDASGALVMVDATMRRFRYHGWRALDASQQETLVEVTLVDNSVRWFRAPAMRVDESAVAAASVGRFTLMPEHAVSPDRIVDAFSIELRADGSGVRRSEQHGVDGSDAQTEDAVIGEWTLAGGRVEIRETRDLNTGAAACAPAAPNCFVESLRTWVPLLSVGSRHHVLELFDRDPDTARGANADPGVRVHARLRYHDQAP